MLPRSRQPHGVLVRKPKAPSQAPPPHDPSCSQKLKGVCTCSGKPLSREAERALCRPDDFFQLSGEQQWAIDKSLSILDWDGS